MNQQIYNNPLQVNIRIDYSRYESIKQAYNNYLYNIKEIMSQKDISNYKQEFLSNLEQSKTLVQKNLTLSNKKISYLNKKIDSIATYANETSKTIVTTNEIIKQKITGLTKLRTYYEEYRTYETKIKSLYTDWLTSLSFYIERVGML